MKPKRDLNRLIDRYVAAANALNKYRLANGLKPGVRVRAQWRDEPAKAGVIAPYGPLWKEVNGMSVPVLLDNGRYQPWSMDFLTVETQPPSPLSGFLASKLKPS